MGDSVDDIINKFKETYPSDAFVVCKFTAPGGTSSYHGTCLADLKLNNDDWLHIYKLTSSSEPTISDNDVKAKAFPFVYDTKSETSSEKRRDSLRDSLKTVFPEHNVNVFIFGRSWNANARNHKAHTWFTKEYGSDVYIVLS